MSARKQPFALPSDWPPALLMKFVLSLRQPFTTSMRIENSWFKRDDWLQLDPTHLWFKPTNPRSFCLELENVTGGSSEIRRQRLVTPDAQTITTSNYQLGP